MTKIAFTSCCHYEHDKDQVTWAWLGAHQPDVVVLMGDNIYMDYGMTLYASLKLDPFAFGSDMQYRYARQFVHPSFQKLIQGEYGKVPEIMAIWDDHDFAWNESLGEPQNTYSPKEEERRLIANTAKKKVSRLLFKAYLNACRSRQKTWPTQDISQGLVSPYEPEGIYETKDIQIGDWQARIIMLDGRYHRRYVEKGKKTLRDLLGDKQAEFLRENILGSAANKISRPDLPIVVSGITLRHGSDNWAKAYPQALDEFFELTRAHGSVLVLSGDIHKNRLNYDKADAKIEKYPGCIEAVASGAGIYYAGKLLRGLCRNYGLLKLEENQIGTLEVYDRNHFVAGDDAGSIKFDCHSGNIVDLGFGDTPRKRSFQVQEIRALIEDVHDDVPEGLDIN